MDRRHAVDVPREERDGGGSPFVTGTFHSNFGVDSGDPLVDLARATGRPKTPARRNWSARRDDAPRPHRAVGADHDRDAHRHVPRQRGGDRPVAVGGGRPAHQHDLARAAGANAAATLPDDPWAEEGFNFLERQTSGIGGGTTEMARNNISEKVLKMPREITHDKNMPFRDVPKGPPGN